MSWPSNFRRRVLFSPEGSQCLVVTWRLSSLFNLAFLRIFHLKVVLARWKCHAWMSCVTSIIIVLYVYVCTRMCKHVGLRRYFLSRPSPHVLRQGLLLKPELTNVIRPDCPAKSANLRVFASPTEVAGLSCHAWIFMWVLGTELRFACLQAKHFID